MTCDWPTVTLDSVTESSQFPSYDLSVAQLGVVRPGVCSHRSYLGRDTCNCYDCRAQITSIEVLSPRLWLCNICIPHRVLLSPTTCHFAQLEEKV